MTLRETLEAMRLRAERDAETVRAARPDIINGRSDGRRVRYVRATTTADTLRDVLALLDREAVR